MPSNHFIFCHPLLLLPSIFPSISFFSNESALHIRWPKYWSFSFNISPTNEHPRLIYFRMDLLDLFAVQGTRKSLLQHHSLKASILWCSAFVIVQFSHPYMTTGKTIALTRRIFVGKVMSLLFNMLSRLVITFPRSKRFLISWPQSPSAMIVHSLYIALSQGKLISNILNLVNQEILQKVWSGSRSLPADYLHPPPNSEQGTLSSSAIYEATGLCPSAWPMHGFFYTGF